MDGPFKKEYKIITVAWHVITLLSFADDLRKCLINYKVLSKLSGIPWSVMILEKLCAEVPNERDCSLLFYKNNTYFPINNLTTEFSELCKKQMKSSMNICYGHLPLKILPWFLSKLVIIFRKCGNYWFNSFG